MFGPFEIPAVKLTLHALCGRHHWLACKKGQQACCHGCNYEEPLRTVAGIHPTTGRVTELSTQATCQVLHFHVGRARAMGPTERSTPARQTVHLLVHSAPVSGSNARNFLGNPKACAIISSF